MNHQPLNIKAISCLGVPPMGGGLFKSWIINHVKLLCKKRKNKYTNPNGKWSDFLIYCSSTPLQKNTVPLPQTQDLNQSNFNKVNKFWKLVFEDRKF
jgi:hypothetical protein